MQELLRLALAATQARVAERSPPPRVRPLGVALALVVMVPCLAAANILLLVALWACLMPFCGPVGTPLAVAGALLLEAAGCLPLLCRRPVPQASAPVAPLLMTDLLPGVAEAGRMLGEHKHAGLLAALLAGVAAGSRRG